MRVRSSVGRLNAVAPAGDIDQVSNLLLGTLFQWYLVVVVNGDYFAT